MDSCLDSNVKIGAKWTFIFSRILIGRKFMSLKNGFLTYHEHQTKVNRIFSASVSTPLSIPMSKSSRNRLSYFCRILIGRKIFIRTNRFATRLEYRTKVNRIFSASVSSPLSIPMSRLSPKGLSYFLEFWLVEKFFKEKIDLSRLWNIQQKSIEFSQHQCRLLSRFQWADCRQKDFHIFSNSDWSKIYVFKKWISHGSRASNTPLSTESNFLSISMDSSLGSNEQKVAKWTFIFSRILIGRKILEWKKSVFHRFRV